MPELREGDSFADPDKVMAIRRETIRALGEPAGTAVELRRTAARI